MHVDAPNDADLPNVLDRAFDGYASHTHLASDLTYVCVLSAWHYVCLLVDLSNREIVGHAAGVHKDAKLVKSAFATVAFTSTCSTATGAQSSTAWPSTRCSRSSA